MQTEIQSKEWRGRYGWLFNLIALSGLSREEA